MKTLWTNIIVEEFESDDHLDIRYTISRLRRINNKNYGLAGFEQSYYVDSVKHKLYSNQQ